MTNNGDTVDVLVIGAGASGAAFAWSLAESGINVMCLENRAALVPLRTRCAAGRGPVGWRGPS